MTQILMLGPIAMACNIMAVTSLISSELQVFLPVRRERETGWTGLDCR